MTHCSLKPCCVWNAQGFDRLCCRDGKGTQNWPSLASEILRFLCVLLSTCQLAPRRQFDNVALLPLQPPSKVLQSRSLTSQSCRTHTRSSSRGNKKGNKRSAAISSFDRSLLLLLIFFLLFDFFFYDCYSLPLLPTVSGNPPGKGSMMCMLNFYVDNRTLGMV